MKTLLYHDYKRWRGNYDGIMNNLNQYNMIWCEFQKTAIKKVLEFHYQVPDRLKVILYIDLTLLIYIVLYTI